MHPSEVWPCGHRQRGDEGGSSGSQEVNSVIQSAACLMSLFLHSLSYISAVQLNYSECFCLRLAERGMALAGSEGGVSIPPN